VAAAHVAQLVPEQCAQLVRVELLHARGGQHDERLVEPDRLTVEERGLPHVKLGQLGDVERLSRLRVPLVDLRVLPVIDPDRGGEVGEAEAPLIPHPEESLDHVVEAAQLTQRGERAPVGRVLPGPRADAGEHQPPPRRGLSRCRRPARIL
jgi:hypothetical protein